MTGDSWPTAEQTLLLQATLLDGDAARRALDQWRSRTLFDQLDRASTRLLPLLYQRLLAEDCADPLLPRLRDAYDRAASRNSALAQAAADAIQILHAARIDTVVLKGMALVASGLTPIGARPMADCDLLVPETHALAARDVLIREGWRLEGRLDADLLSVRHAVSWRSPSGPQLDLHWHVLAECCEAGADARFWAAAEPATLNGATTRTLCAADMVLHTCVHGLGWTIVPPLRWVTDAVTVIRAATPAVDWERLVDEAERRVLVLPMIDALQYLRDTFDAPVPAWVCARLSKVTVPRWALAEYRVKMRRRSRQRQVLFHWSQHRRLSSSGTVLGDLVRLPSYVRRRWSVRPFTALKGH